jgi:hypothetical protein
LAEPPRSTRLQAEQATESEIHQREEARTHTEREAAPAHPAEDDIIDARLTELQERERALADRERLIESIEALLDRSRHCLEERLERIEERKAALNPTRLPGAARPPSVANGYAGSGSYPD